jgi:hypothetical protein
LLQFTTEYSSIPPAAIKMMIKAHKSIS